MKKTIILSGLAMLSAAYINAADIANDTGIINKIYKCQNKKMPNRIFSPEIKKMLKAKKIKDAKKFFSYGNPDNGKKWLTVPDSQWKNIIL